jgi:transcriptional regulator with XRE-family HTH domain
MRRIADELRVARARLALSRAQVARRAGLARSTIDRIEEAEVGVSVATAAAALAAVDLDLVLQAYPTRGSAVRDVRHALLIDHLRLIATPHWRPRVEVAAGDHGQSADLVLYGEREVQHLEVERRVVDIQAQLRSAMRKREVLAAANPDRAVRLVLVVEDTKRNRAALRLHLPLLTSQLPRTPREVLRSLRTGVPLGADGLLWLRPPSAPAGRAGAEISG